MTVLFSTPIDDRHRYPASAGRSLGACPGDLPWTCDLPVHEGDRGFYLLGCDHEWKAVTDTWHQTLQEAMAQAEFEYEGVPRTWSRPAVTGIFPDCRELARGLANASSRVRFTVRRFMVAVAIVALVLGGITEAVRLRRLAVGYRLAAREHDSREQSSLLEAKLQDLIAEGHRTYASEIRERFESRRIWNEPGARKQAMLGEWASDDAAFYRRQAAYHAGLKRRYERAASRPWESLTPDPPPP